MSAMKAVCQCQGMKEDSPVIALRAGRFSWIEKWGCLTTILCVILGFATGGGWFLLVLGWHIGDIFSPDLICNKCGTAVENSQLRL
jgi:hypothetical protein